MAQRFSPFQRGDRGIQQRSGVMFYQLPEQETFRQQEQTQHYFKMTNPRVSGFSDFPPRNKCLFPTDMKKASWRPTKLGLLGIKHLQKAELSLKDKDQRERGTCDERLLDHQTNPTPHFEAKIQDLYHWNIALVPPLQGLLCSVLPLSPGRKREVEADIFKAQLKQKHLMPIWCISFERKVSTNKGPATWFGIPAVFRLPWKRN